MAKKKKKKMKKKKKKEKKNRPMADSKKKVLAPSHSIIFPHTMRQNILYCGKSYSFHRYCRQKILRLIVFAVLAARGVRSFFQFTSIGATAFQSLSAISLKTIAATAFSFCKYLLICVKVVEKSIRPMAGDCKKVSAPCFKAIKKKKKKKNSVRPMA